MTNQYTACFACDKVSLSKLYFQDKLTQAEIARKFSVSQKVIWRTMRDFGFKARPAAKRYQNGEANTSWKGGKYFDKSSGYFYIQMPNHPNAMKNGYVAIHIFKASEKLGRPLDTKVEVVHHLDGDRNNNDFSNLFVCSTKKHRSLHDQLMLMAYELVKQGKIAFRDGEYVWL